MNDIKANALLDKQNRDRIRKNEVAKAYRLKRGDEMKALQAGYSKTHRAKVKSDNEEALQYLTQNKKSEDDDVIKPIKTELKHNIQVNKKAIDFVSKYEQTGVRGVSDKTASDYMYKISLIHKILSKDDINSDLLLNILTGETNDKNMNFVLIQNMPYLNDGLLLLNTITTRYTKVSSQKSYISPFLTLMSYVFNSSNPNYILLREKFEEFNNSIIEYRKENKPSKDENMIDDFSDEIIIENSVKISNISDKLIYIFYTIQPPRRIEDVFNIKIIFEGYIDSTLDKEFNYIVINEKTKLPSIIIYNNYKTNKHYGTQTIQISHKLLKECIQSYIVKNILCENSKLFNKYATAASFGKGIKRVFTTVYDKSLTLNNIRHSYITWDLREPRTTKYKENLAQMMSHNIQEQQLYMRVK